MQKYIHLLIKYQFRVSTITSCYIITRIKWSDYMQEQLGFHLIATKIILHAPTCKWLPNLHAPQSIKGKNTHYLFCCQPPGTAIQPKVNCSSTNKHPHHLKLANAVDEDLTRRWVTNMQKNIFPPLYLLQLIHFSISFMWLQLLSFFPFKISPVCDYSV